MKMGFCHSPSEFMKVLYLTYENVFRTAILQAMVIKPLSLLAEKYGIQFVIASSCKPSEKDAIYTENKAETLKRYPFLVVREFGKNLKKNQSVLTFLADILPMLKFAIREGRKSDLLHCRGYGGALIGLLVFYFTRTPFIFDMRGVLPEETVEVGKISAKSFRYKLLKVAEKLLIKKSHTVFTVSEAFKTYVEENFGKDNVVNLNNPTDFREYSPTKIFDDKITFIYSGSMQVWHAPEITVRHFEKVYASLQGNAHLLFCTNDPEKASKLFAQIKLPDDAYEICSVPFRKMPDYYARAHVAFCLIQNSFSKSVCFPVKFSEYIASQLFVVINRKIGDLESIVKRHHCGIVIDNLADVEQNAKLIAEAVSGIWQKKDVGYDRNALGFLNWENDSIAKIYSVYSEIARTVIA